MAFEDPEDLAGFFDPDEFGVEALFRPDDSGSGVPCVVVISKAVEATSIYDVHAASSSAFISVPVQSCPNVKEGDSFEIVKTGQKHIVNEDPQLQLGGNIWKFAAPES